MAQEDNNRLVEWLLLLREQAPIVRRRFDEWVEVVREEPRVIWETPAVRYTVYALVAILSIRIAFGFAGTLAPPPPRGARQAATTADFHVVCSAERCGHHFVIHKEFGFRKFPVTCPKCQRETGQRAQRCNSPTCRGRWIIPEPVGKMLRCPHCGDKLN